MSKHEQVVSKESKPSASNSVKEIKADGSFNRQKNRFTTAFGQAEGELPVEAGRYRLFWSAVCPWAHHNILPKGPDLSGLTSQHHRQVLSNNDEKFLIH